MTARVDVERWCHASDHTIGGEPVTLELDFPVETRRGPVRTFRVRMRETRSGELQPRVWVSGRIVDGRTMLAWNAPAPGPVNAEVKGEILSLVEKRIAEIERATRRPVA